MHLRLGGESPGPSQIRKRPASVSATVRKRPASNVLAEEPALKEAALEAVLLPRQPKVAVRDSELQPINSSDELELVCGDRYRTHVWDLGLGCIGIAMQQQLRAWGYSVSKDICVDWLRKYRLGLGGIRGGISSLAHVRSDLQRWYHVEGLNYAQLQQKFRASTGIWVHKSAFRRWMNLPEQRLRMLENNRLVWYRSQLSTRQFVDKFPKKDFSFWAMYGSWSFCDGCGSLHFNDKYFSEVVYQSSRTSDMPLTAYDFRLPTSDLRLTTHDLRIRRTPYD